MLQGLIGRKVGMSQFFDTDGKVIPVTVVEVGPCAVIYKKTAAVDGYDAVQIGFDEITKEKCVNKPLKGHFKANNVKAYKYLKEFKSEDSDEYKSGDIVTVGNFKDLSYVDVIGLSIGKGFQGVVKRHHFKGGPGGHGSMFHRRPGAIGMREHPGETLKGKRMAGRMGGKRITVKNLKVVKIFEDKNLILLNGSVPGPKNGIVVVKQTNAFIKSNK
jgi:large subunit ribosomal protein L3